MPSPMSLMWRTVARRGRNVSQWPRTPCGISAWQGTVPAARLAGSRCFSTPSGMTSGLVSCEWLKAELDRPDATKLCVIDATWYLPNSPFAAAADSGGARAEFIHGPRLPGAAFFDIDEVSALHPQGLSPHMLPTEEMFGASMASLGVTEDTRVVIYDRHGIFSAPRLWYTLKVAFGHAADVAVLDGGLPRWRALGLPLEHGPSRDVPTPAHATSWKRLPTAVWDIEQVRCNIDSRCALLVDARPAARFLGAVPEPRAGMRGGHMPNSVNVPFMELLTAPPRRMRPNAELDEIFAAAEVPMNEIIAKQSNGPLLVTSCGSGLTACIVGLAMHQRGLPLSKWAVYDGSWAEWGGVKDTPIVKKDIVGNEQVVP